LGEPKIGVPNLTGRTQAEAEAMLSAADHLKVGGATEAYINTQPTGHVFLQQPAPGTLVSYDTAVDLFISLGLWTGVDETPPMVSLSVNPERVYLGEAVTIFAWAGDNVGVANQSLTINGNPVFATDNELVYTADAGGLYTVTLTAADAAGHTRTENKTFQVIDPNDTTPPAVSLNETDCIDVTDLYTVTGTVADPGGVSYQLFHREQGSNQWIYFAEGSGNTITGSLGVFDPTVLKNGVYEIALYAEDLLGNSASALGCALVDGGLKIGQVNLPTTDISLPDMGFPLSLEREYDSRNQGSGDFGPGWSLPASAVKPMVTKSLGGGWDQEARGGFFTTYYLIEKHRHFAVIRFSDTEMIKFKMDVNPKSSVLYPYGPHLPLTVSYQPLDGTQGTLQALDADPNVMMINNELREYGVELYQPTRFKYTRPDGTVYLISMQNGLESITDVYGHAISYDHNGIHHSSGVGITFERGAGDRIEKITDPFGRQVTYYYDAEGLLERVVQSGSEPYAMRVLNDYAYAQGVAARPVLKAIKAPDGTELGQFEYDSQGRVTGLIDANGHRVIYGYDVPNHRQEITDRLGNVTLYEYDDKGNVTSKTDALGGATQWAYDDRGNKLSETDPLGNTTSYTYDERDNLLTDTDPLGNTTTYTYNSRNQVSSITDPNGNTTTHTYDAKGDLLTTADPYGNLTTNTYDADGNLISTTDCRGNTATYEYDEYGNKIAEIDPLGHETAHTYDANGNQLTQTVTRTAESDPVTTVTTYQYDNKNQLIKTIDSNGFATVTEYNLLGKKAAEIDKNGSRTEYEYDGNANLTATIYPDGTTQVNTYDAEGNRIAATDLDGHTTTFEYDELKRLVRTIYSDGTETAMQYDAAGQLIATIDENGNPTEFEYDAAGRRTAVIDALGNVTTFAYDANGNQLRMTDANGHTPTFIYDKLNRRTKTTFPDGTFTETVYDCLGNKIAEIDQAGVTTQFEYDELGRLEAVIDALDGQTTYTYDEVGNKLTQTDPNGHVKTWAYDNLGRAIRHTLPLGQFETYGYDPNGNLIRKTDFNGDTTTYEYSTCCNSLLRKHFADGSQVSFNYTPTGQRETVTDARGVTAYSYDLRDRLTAVIHPDGTIVSYTYDAKGNRTSVSVPSGTTIYAFDELNRLITATAPNGGVTDYTYDSVGNRKSVSYPNGTMASYTYDSLNRLTYLENRKSSGELISSYSYTLGPAGNRTKAVENSGRTVEYTYDTLYRLVEEDITDPVLGNETINYTYDAFGNRLAKSDSTGTVNYTYGANDRLLSEIGAGLSHTYTYDNNGNTLTKSDGTNIIDYVYDYENRLTSVSAAGSLTESVYDADGIRVGKNVDGEITHYVVDKNSDYAQVLEETDGSGSLTVSYIYGDDLISQHRGETDRYYLYDGQMSTRQLQGATESVTDEYTYDAFGILLDQAGATVNNYLYTGEQYDPNAGFYYLRARYYNPNEGRFVTSDPFTGFELDPPTLHKYLYCSNNPSNRIDPSGEFSLSEVAVSLSVRATLFTLRHPLLATTIGLVTNALLPVEVHDAMMSSGLPGVSVLGETGQAQARVFRLIKSQRFRSFVKSNLSAAGTLWNVTGHEFERFARKYLFKGAIPGTKIIERTPDLIWKNFTIELKTGRNFGQREIRQLKEFSQHTGNLAYIFLIKPTKSTINKITKAGGKVFYIYDENGN
jgi:RHS repeat-associated protein